MMTEEVIVRSTDELIDTYDRVGNTPVFWMFKGDELLRSTELLKKNDFHYIDSEDRCRMPEEDRINYKFGNILKMLRG